jgi:Flp pilus assembly pilin Flp
MKDTQTRVEEQKNEKGASLVEYALLVALIAAISIAGVKLLGQHASTQFSTINANIG